jgi:hypothetical protein
MTSGDENEDEDGDGDEDDDDDEDGDVTDTKKKYLRKDLPRWSSEIIIADAD